MCVPERRILHLSTFSSDAVGGMETHASALRRRTSLGGGWIVEPINETTGEAAQPSPTDVLMVDAWEWPKLAIGLRSRWSQPPIVARSGGNDAEFALAAARSRLTPSSYRAWVKQVVASVDLVIANSAFSVERLRCSDFGEIPAAVVTGGAPSVSRKPCQGGGPPRVVVAARLVDFKGVDECIEAIAAAQEQLELVLIVVGDGPLRQQMHRRAQVRLRPGTFEFKGTVLREDCLAIIASADVLLSMSRGVWRSVGRECYYHTETMGRSICEALCAGVPVVATAVGGVPEVLNSDMGTLVDEGDIEGAARAITDWLQRSKPTATTASAYRRQLSWTSVFERYDRLLCDVCETRARIQAGTATSPRSRLA